MIYARYVIGVYLMNLGFRIMPSGTAKDLLRDYLEDYSDEVEDRIAEARDAAMEGPK